MCARELDRRFFGRGVQADIAVLAPVALGEGDVPRGSALEKRKDLVDALAHLDEAGSLLAPGEGDLAAIREAIGLTGDGGLFGSSSRERLQRALSTCETLARRHDCVVANPPYMGSSSFGPFMSRWVKRSYPDVKSDLCTCFIERGFNLAKDRGYAAMITMQSWMFLGSFEKMRSSLIGSKSILSMLHLGPRAFDAIGGEVVNVTADVVYNGRTACAGAYVRLVDINGSDAKRKKALEAIGNPDCGWFYRRDAETFKQIPGTPIAYWASEVTYEAFSANEKIREHAWGCNGMTTGENDRFLRLWFEVGSRSSEYCSSSAAEAKRSGATWFPYNKGGDFRKWYGNEEWVIDWKDDGKRARDYGHLVPRSQKYMFLPEITWSKISSGKAAFRYKDKGHLFDVAGLCLFPNEGKADLSLLAFCNSSVAQSFLSFLCPTLNFEVGGVCSMPFVDLNSARGEVDRLASDCISDSLTDYNSFEISCDFKRHPLV
ncbi:Eco57I restriction-modification methylase domain-containing protein [Collinsella sp. HCP28S3_E5]